MFTWSLLPLSSFTHIRFSLFIHFNIYPKYLFNLFRLYLLLIKTYFVDYSFFDDFRLPHPSRYSTSLLHYNLFKWIQCEESWIDYVLDFDWPEEKFWIFSLPSIRLTSLSLSQSERTSRIICDTLLRRGCKVFHLIITKCSYPIFFELLRRTKIRFPERNP